MYENKQLLIIPFFLNEGLNPHLYICLLFAYISIVSSECAREDSYYTWNQGTEPKLWRPLQFRNPEDDAGR